MKISILTGFLVLCMVAARPALAVWPPATSLAEETDQSTSSHLTAASSGTLPRPRALVDKLEDDERRLEKALIDLRKDTFELKHDRGYAAHSPESLKS
jgi:hypothetical protein